MRILVLDLGTKTGYAFEDWGPESCFSGAPIFGTMDFKPKRFEGNGMRFLRFTQYLSEMRPDIIFFEEVRRHLGPDAAHCYGGFLSHLQVYCDRQDPKVPYEGVPVGTIKKFATGRGNASKEEMISAIKKRGFDVKDDNQADALFLLLWVVENRKGGLVNGGGI